MVHINEKFDSLNPEKQDRIINAAIAEFSRNGYKNASTNQIVKDADISKGLLFHYFGSKKNLFLSIYKYCLDTMKTEFDAMLDTSQKDLFERVKQVHVMKMELTRMHPNLFKFIEKAYIELNEGVKSEINKLNDETLMSSMDTLLKSIDPPNLKEGLDLSKVINMILWISQGYGDQIIKTSNITGKPIDYDKAIKEADQYMDILKRLVLEKTESDT